MFAKILLGTICLSIHFSTQANEIKTFENLWNDFYQNSFEQKALLLQKEENEISSSRAQKHWLPRVFATGQAFSSNDPTQVFFTNLGQRSISLADFNPTDLNRPERKIFSTATLGVDLPLYEGGMKSSQVSFFRTLVEASNMELKAKQSQLYSDLALHYASLIIYSQNIKGLKELHKKIKTTLSQYEVGNKDNPVGYSGLLGLKGVANRIEAMMQEFDLKKMNAHNWIKQKISKDQPWNPDLSLNLKDFINKNLMQQSHTSTFSSLLLAQELKVSALENVQEMEKARYLPKIGLFAQNNIYHGSRDTSSAQSFGLYLMWDLFNSDSVGRLKQAKAQFEAKQAQLEAGKQEEKIMLTQLLDTQATLEKSLVLLQDSDHLLKEQSSHAMTLFQNGMLNALQLADLINRRVDLIQNKNTAENQYLEMSSKIYQMNH